MWIVVVVNSYYPSVFHFDSESEAIKSYEKNRNEGYVTHLAEIKAMHFNEELIPTLRNKEAKQTVEYFKANIEQLDVEWYTSR